MFTQCVLYTLVFLPEKSSPGILTINSAKGRHKRSRFTSSFAQIFAKWGCGIFFLDILAHLSSIGTLDLTESAHVSESDSWEKHRSESNSHIAGKITSLNAKRFWLKGLRKRQMPVIGPDTNLFIAKPKQGEVWSSGFTSQDQALGLLGFHFSENYRDGRWERLVRSSCPHAPAGVGRDCLFASFSSASSRFKQLQQEDCYCKKIPLPTCPPAKPLF